MLALIFREDAGPTRAVRSGRARAFAVLYQLCAAAFLFLSAGSVNAACGHDDIVVAGSPAEQQMACDALGPVLEYFAGFGSELEPTVTIVFMQEVACEFEAGPAVEEPCPVRLSGFYDFNRKLIEITSVDTPSRRDRRPWGLDWTRDIVFSVLQHEMIHMAVAEALGDDFRNLGHPWHELIAYGVQFDLMDEALRRRILDNYPDAVPFRSADNVNALLHAADPYAFGVRAYLYLMAHGGRSLIAEILKDAPNRNDDATGFLWTM